MHDLSAIRAALDLHGVPTRIARFRLAPLPSGVSNLIQIAASEPAITKSVSVQLGRDPDDLRQAATFFVEQVMMAPGSNHYRVLGTEPSAGSEEIRRNMALLMQWLHPDRIQSDPQRHWAQRVSEAWNEIKTDERRSRYDTRLRDTSRKATEGAQGRTSSSSPASKSRVGTRSRRVGRKRRPSLWRSLLRRRV